MRDIAPLDRNMLVTEFDLARSIWEKLQRDGYGPVKAAAILYKHGYLDGKSAIKSREDEAYRKKFIAESALKAAGLPIPDYSRPVRSNEQEDTTNE